MVYLQRGFLGCDISGMEEVGLALFWHMLSLLELPHLGCLQFVDVGTMISPTVLARRSLAYLLSDQAEAALRDGMQAQYVHPEWPTASTCKQQLLQS